jgi:hypothetical protein
MTDEELIARLRSKRQKGNRFDSLEYEAADRIKALIATNEELESKLTKAVEALENVIEEYDLFRKDEYERGLAPLDDEIHEARTTLAAVS